MMEHRKKYPKSDLKYYLPSLCASLLSAESLLRFCAAWNTNARNCHDAQAVLQVLLTHLPPDELLQYQGARTHLEGLIPYTGQQRACVCVCQTEKRMKCVYRALIQVIMYKIF